MDVQHQPGRVDDARCGFVAALLHRPARLTISTVYTCSTIWAFEVKLMSAPIPEPETYALMLAGLGLVGFMARRRKQA